MVERQAREATHAEARTARPGRDRASGVPGATHPLLALQRAAGNAAATRAVQRLAAPGLEEEQFAGPQGGALPPQAAERIEAKRGGGSSLDAALRGQFEESLGLGLGHVRVHSDLEADTLARGMSAKAFTTGSDIFLRGDVNERDDEVLAHELTHVAQQAAAPPDTGPLTVEDADADSEHEAAASAEALTSPVGRIQDED